MANWQLAKSHQQIISCSSIHGLDIFKQTVVKREILKSKKIKTVRIVKINSRDDCGARYNS